MLTLHAGYNAVTVINSSSTSNRALIKRLPCETSITIASGFLIRGIVKSNTRHEYGSGVITINPRKGTCWKVHNSKQFTFTNKAFKDVYVTATEYYCSINSTVNRTSILKKRPRVDRVINMMDNFCFIRDLPKVVIK